ncbi:MAG: 2OG-Fe dioxygenase family protein [Proteobacteria bacterium]|nr:2OG-Fe dioxygenase family protein [Pseudomonadota bacterium]
MRNQLPALDFGRLAESFDALPLDRHLHDGGTYRRRRFSRFVWERGATALRRLPHQTFFQSRSVNPLHGGFPRHFAPLPTSTASDPALAQLVGLFIDCLPIEEDTLWVNVHQIRVLAGEHPVGPAPEGIHSDGHDFVAIVLVRRENVVGGRSIVRDAAEAELVSTTMESPLDAVVVDDRRTLHGVTPIRRAGPGPALRDMLLLDFNRPTGSSSGSGSGS